jgi:CTP:molybdopterin cytidylyltransferase MocA
MGRPKALVTGPDGTRLLERGLLVLRRAGCDPVVAVLGASAAEARAAAGAADQVVEAQDWADGQSASLRAGLTALHDTDAYAACVLLVDLTDVGADAVARVVGAAGEGPDVLARAAYQGTPGHPAVIGRAHWPGVLAALHGDAGARDYLGAHPHLVVECGDLATGRDADTPADLR